VFVTARTSSQIASRALSPRFNDRGQLSSTRACVDRATSDTWEAKFWAMVTELEDFLPRWRSQVACEDSSSRCDDVLSSLWQSDLVATASCRMWSAPVRTVQGNSGACASRVFSRLPTRRLASLLTARHQQQIVQSARQVSPSRFADRGVEQRPQLVTTVGSLDPDTRNYLSALRRRVHTLSDVKAHPSHVVSSADRFGRKRLSASRTAWHKFRARVVPVRASA